MALGASVARTSLKATELLVSSGILLKMRGRGLPEGRAESTRSHPFRPYTEPRFSPSVQPLPSRTRSRGSPLPPDHLTLCCTPRGDHLSVFLFLFTPPLFLHALLQAPRKAGLLQAALLRIPPPRGPIATATILGFLGDAAGAEDPAYHVLHSMWERQSGSVLTQRWAALVQVSFLDVGVW